MDGLESFVIKEAEQYLEDLKFGKSLKNHEFAIIVKSLADINNDRAKILVLEYFKQLNSLQMSFFKIEDITLLL